MTQEEIKEKVAEETKLSKADVERAVKSYLKNLKESLFTDKEAKVPGIGTIKVKSRKARTGRNPRTGQELNIPASISAGFVVSKSFKDELNEKFDVNNF